MIIYFAATEAGIETKATTATTTTTTTTKKPKGRKPGLLGNARPPVGKAYKGPYDRRLHWG